MKKNSIKTMERLATYIWNNGIRANHGDQRTMSMDEVDALIDEGMLGWFIYYAPTYNWSKTMNGYKFYIESQRRADFRGRLAVEKC